MRSAVLFITLALQYVFNVPISIVVGAEEAPAINNTKSADPSAVPGGDRGRKVKDKELSHRDTLDSLHRKVSDTLSAHHEGRDLLDEDALKRFTKKKEMLDKRRGAFGEEGADPSDRQKGYKMKGKEMDRHKMLDSLHRKVSDRLAAHHEGRDLLDEDALKRMTKKKEMLDKRRGALGEEGADPSDRQKKYKMKGKEMGRHAMFDSHVSDTLAAHREGRDLLRDALAAQHEGRDLSNEDALKRMTKMKEMLKKKRQRNKKGKQWKKKWGAGDEEL